MARRTDPPASNIYRHPHH
uniref:Uncharacterized protein n=1 Tax=Anopheles quadriannulatus TaxID=34691 RepID=A0A182XRN7_ANOQN